MSRNEKVSLWVGRFDNKKEFNSYILPSSTDDGDYITSLFEENFNINNMDNDFMESHFFNKNIKKQLKKISYEEVVAEQFILLLEDEDLNNYNTFILLYEFDYNGETKEVIKGNNVLKFIGRASYEI